MAGEGAGRVELLDQPLERQVLVRERLQVGVPDTGEQVTERRIPRRVRPQHQRVDEEADEFVQGLVRTPGHRRPERNVRPRSEPGEQCRQSRLAHHEDRRTRGPRQLHHAAVHPGVQRHRDRVAPMTRHSRTRAVRGQRQLLRQTCQHLTPVPQLTRRHTLRVLHPPQHFLLPQRVVRVLHGERLRGRRPAGGVGRVSGGDLPGQRPHRPAVADDVVEDEEKDVVVLGDREQGGPQGHPAGQVEGAAGEVAEVGLQASGVRGDVLPRHLGLGLLCRDDVLPGAGLGLREAGAQRLVAADRVGERLPQGLAVQGAAQAEGERHVVERAVVDPSEEPEALLGEGERGGTGAGHGAQRGPGSDGGVEAAGEAWPGRRCLEQVAYGHLHPERGADPGDQPGGEQGVAAEVEEAVVRTDRAGAEDLGEQPAEDLLARGARGPAAR
ncbi:hypothetical protein SNARM312S_03287 [Streptomyces narbonensis]